MNYFNHVHKARVHTIEMNGKIEVLTKEIEAIKNNKKLQY